MRVGASLSQFILSAFATLAILALLVIYAFKGDLSVSDIAFLVFLVGGLWFTTVEIGLSLWAESRKYSAESSPLLGEGVQSCVVDIPKGSQETQPSP
ncbi:hypothetical protein AAHA92_31613 [Salvia divinorum]|uniref:MARVEL domain-containing protein n=1 Tax=Salvia divinorum TaxID=28513 RepID=A0ABD1FIK8_SALDI